MINKVILIIATAMLCTSCIRHTVTKIVQCDTDNLTTEFQNNQFLVKSVACDDNFITKNIKDKIESHLRSIGYTIPSQNESLLPRFNIYFSWGISKKPKLVGNILYYENTSKLVVLVSDTSIDSTNPEKKNNMDFFYKLFSR